MASTPSEPKSDSSGKIDLSRTPQPKDPSLGEGDWLNEIPDAPVVPEGSGNYPSFVDSDFDIQTLFPGPAPSEHAAADSEIVDLGAKPNADPLSPASGWFDSGVLKTPPPLRPKAKTPQAAAPSDGGSDIFSNSMRDRDGGDGSEVLRSSPYPSPSSSNIFDAPTEGSSKFFNPTDGTEEVGESKSLPSERTGDDDEDDLFLAFDQPPSELFNKEAEAAESLSGLMDDGSNEVNSLLDQLNLHFPTPSGKKPVRPARVNDPDSMPDFNAVGNGSSGSNLFRDDGDADVSHFLGEMTTQEKTDGPDSTIFHRAAKDPSSINLDRIPIMGSSDDRDAVDYTGEDVDGSESIFQMGPQRAESALPFPEDSSVNFNLPKRKAKIVALDAGVSEADDGGEIDWTMPSGADQPSISARRPVAQTGVTDHFDAFDYEPAPDDGMTRRLAEPPSAIFAPVSSPSKVFPRPSVSVTESGSRTSLQEPRSGVYPVPSPKMGGSGIFEKRSAHTVDLDGESGRRDAAAKRGKSGMLGWLAGSAAGLLVGVGLSGGAYLAFVDKPETTLRVVTPNQPTTAPSNAGEKLELGEARKLLAVGDPARALPALEAAGDSASPVVIAERGKARWLVRIRELAAEKKIATADDASLKLAVADLEQIVAKSETLTTAEDKRTAVEAALRIGLTKELTGDGAGATAYYTASAKRFPASKVVFDTAVRRVKAMPPRAAGAKAALLPQQAEDLAQFVLPALFLIQADVADGDAPEAEAGFLFWEAINEASVNNFVKARAQLAKARAAHDARRLALAGRGLNPLSDPMEQIFLRCCNDLNAFWIVKEQLYTHPTAGPIFAKAGLNKIGSALDQIAGAKPDPKVAEELAATKAKLAETETAAAAKVKKATDDAAAAKTTGAALVVQLQQLQTKLLESADRADAAKQEAARAAANLTAVNAGLDKVVLALKSAKLVDDGADSTTVLKTMPDVLKKLTLAAGSVDAKKAAEALTTAKKDLDAAKTALADKDKAATTAKEQLDAAKADLVAKLAAAKVEADKAVAAAKTETTELRTSIAAEVKKGVAAAEAEVTKTIAGLQQQMQASAKQLERLQDDHRKQLADARAGAVVPLTGGEIYARERAAGLFGKAVEAYFANRFVEAEAMLQTIVELHAGDARYWYFLGLAKFAQGKPDAAEAFKRGAEQENRNLPSTRDINDALERVQGSARAALKPYRP